MPINETLNPKTITVFLLPATDDLPDASPADGESSTKQRQYRFKNAVPHRKSMVFHIRY